jgi:hypothetical protein
MMSATAGLRLYPMDGTALAASHTLLSPITARVRQQ